MHATHLFTGTLNVRCPHLPRNALSMLLRDWGQTLSLEEVNAGAFRAEIGFQADQDERSGGAEVQDFGVPLKEM